MFFATKFKYLLPLRTPPLSSFRDSDILTLLCNGKSWHYKTCSLYICEQFYASPVATHYSLLHISSIGDAAENQNVDKIFHLLPGLKWKNDISHSHPPPPKCDQMVTP